MVRKASSFAPHPDPLVEEIEAARARCGVPMSRLSREIGRDPSYWANLLQNGSSPKVVDARMAAGKVGLVLELRDVTGTRVA